MSYLFLAAAPLLCVPLPSARAATVPSVLAYMSVITGANLPDAAATAKWAADTQVKHSFGLLAGWKQRLGADWRRVYAASNTIHVTLRNNVLFSVRAQFFKPDDINARLMLIETVSFTTTQQDMLHSLARIISDRTKGELSFGSPYLMDHESTGGDARDAIATEAASRGMAVNLPPMVPFGSHQWLSLVTPGPGATSLADLH